MGNDLGCYCGYAVAWSPLRHGRLGCAATETYVAIVPFVPGLNSTVLPTLECIGSTVCGVREKLERFETIAEAIAYQQVVPAAIGSTRELMQGERLMCQNVISVVSSISLIDSADLEKAGPMLTALTGVEFAIFRALFRLAADSRVPLKVIL